MRSGGIERTYTLIVPQGYVPHHERPLIVLLHGYTSSGDQILAYSRLGKLADSEGFILAAPNGTGRPRGWNCGFVNAGESGVDDIGFIGDLIGRLRDELAIDPRRIYLAGHSNGAMLAYAAGSGLSDRIAAIAVIEGSNAIDRPLFKRSVPAPAHPVSAIIFHGKNDRLVPYEPATSRLALYAGPQVAAASWASEVGAGTAPKERALGAAGSATIWSGRDATVELVTVSRGNHMWPGAIGSTSDGIDATDMLLAFFRARPKR